MDISEPKENSQGQGQRPASINFYSPCENHIAERDFIEVNIYLPGKSAGDSEATEGTVGWNVRKLVASAIAGVRGDVSDF